MTVTPVQAVGNDTAKIIQQYAQNVSQTSQQTTSGSVNAFPSAVETTAPVADVQSNSNGFMNSVADTVYNEIDVLSAKLPNFGSEQSAVNSYKDKMVPSSEMISPMQDAGMKKGKDDAVAALSKTFDHAIFMAMVNQVVSGVSDTSRTLIRQS